MTIHLDETGLPGSVLLSAPTSLLGARALPTRSTIHKGHCRIECHARSPLIHCFLALSVHSPTGVPNLLLSILILFFMLGTLPLSPGSSRHCQALCCCLPSSADLLWDPVPWVMLGLDSLKPGSRQHTALGRWRKTPSSKIL